MMLTFLGSPVLNLTDDSPTAPWLVLALVLEAATVTITAAVHLPLNAAVQSAAPEFSDAARPVPRHPAAVPVDAAQSCKVAEWSGTACCSERSTRT
jgi:hypothetical protein